MTKTQKYTVDALEDNKDQFAVYRCVDVAALESELSAARGDIEEERKYSRGLLDQHDKLQAENKRLKKRAEELVGACEFVGAMMYRTKSEFYDKIRVIIENPNWPQENEKD